jgi:hypothetical protein
MATSLTASVSEYYKRYEIFRCVLAEIATLNVQSKNRSGGRGLRPRYASIRVEVRGTWPRLLQFPPKGSRPFG